MTNKFVMGYWRLETTIEPTQENYQEIARAIAAGFYYGQILQFIDNEIVLPEEREEE
jgi:hypothetical protein